MCHDETLSAEPTIKLTFKLLKGERDDLYAFIEACCAVSHITPGVQLPERQEAITRKPNDQAKSQQSTSQSYRHCNDL